MITGAPQESIDRFLDKLEDRLVPYYESLGTDEDLVAALKKEHEEMSDMETYLTPYQNDPEMLAVARDLCEHALRRIEIALHDFHHL